jgi:nitroreductase
MDFDAFRDLASRQRAIRKIDPERPVDDALIEQMLTVATFAPSGGNRQPFRFIVVHDPGVRAKLAEIYDEVANRRYGNAASRTSWSDVPVLIAVCSESRPGNTAGAALAQAGSIFPAVQNLLLAAQALGLGSVLTTLWKEREAEVNAALGLPGGAAVYAILPIGWPDRQYGRNKRQPFSEVTFRDRYGESW